MKKWLLSLVVVLAFATYSYFYKITSEEDAGLVRVSAIPPTQVQPPINYKNGTYQGQSYNAYYGNVQITVTIDSGQITDIGLLDYPSSRQTSERINSQALPLLIQETLQSQSAQIDIITGATQTSEAFIKSLKSALDQAS